MAMTLTDRAKSHLLQLLKTALGGQVPSATLRTSVENLVLDLAFGDRRDLGQKIRDVLSDNRVSQSELTALLAFWVSKWPPSKVFASDFVQKLAGKLDDGELTSDEIGELVSEWLASRLPAGGQLQQLIIAAATQKLDDSALLTAITGYLTRIGAPAVATALKTVIEADEPVTLPAVIQIVAAVLVGEQHITQPGVTKAAQSQAIVGALGTLPANSQLRAILEAVSQKQYGKAAALTLAAIGITADEGLLNALLMGGSVSVELRRIAVEKLTPFIAAKVTGATPAQTTQITELLLDILSGKKPLVAAQSEQQMLGMGPKTYETFTRFRRVCYAVILAVNGGARVSSSPMTQPHIFAAAAITGSTKISDLIPTGKQDLFLFLLQQFTSVEFNISIQSALIAPEVLAEGVTVRQVAATIG